MEELFPVELELGLPLHGWLPMELRLGSFEFRDRASNVLNDPLLDLLELRTFARRKMKGRHRTILWLEPEGYALDAEMHGGALGLQVSFSESAVPPRSLIQPVTSIVAGLVDPSAFAKCIGRAYERLRAEHPNALAKWGEVWRYDATYRDDFGQPNPS